MNYGQVQPSRALVSERDLKTLSARATVISELGEMVNHIGLSELEECCAPLMAIIIQLRRDQSPVDALSLKQSLIEEILGFEVLAKKKDLEDTKITAMRYVLCTVIDEFILNQQYRHAKNWSEKNDWSRQSLVTTFYNDAWGGEKFYEIAEEFIAHPRENQDCLSLMLFFLNLGYEGKYRLIENGSERLALLKEKMHHIIASYDTRQSDASLSPRPNMTPQKPRLFFSKSTAVFISALAMLSVLGFFIFYNMELNNVVATITPQLSTIK